VANDHPSPLDEERRKWLFGETGGIDETLNQSGATPDELDDSLTTIEPLEAKEPHERSPEPVEATLALEKVEPELESDRWDKSDLGQEQTLEETMGGPQSDLPSDEPLGELPDSGPETAHTRPPNEPPWEMPDLTEKSPSEGPIKWDVEAEPTPALPEENAAVTHPTELPAAEPEPIPETPDGMAPALPEEESKLPSWVVKAEAEAAKAAAAAAAVAPAESASVTDLKSAPTIDWSPGGTQEVANRAAEILATKAAPSSASPDAQKTIKTMEAMEAPSPVKHPPEAKPLPMIEAQERDDKEVVLERITENRQLKLMARIDELLDNIYTRFSAETGKNTLEEVLKLLKTARHTLIENPRDYDTAEYYTLRAKMLIDRFQSVRRDSYRWTGVVLFIYESVLLLLVVVGWLGGEGLADKLTGQGVPAWAIAPWTTMMACTAGAILGALWALVEHVAIDQDFGKQHRMWYFVSPFKGFILGAIIYFMMHAGTLAMGVATPVNAGGTPLDPDWFLLTLAFLIGFQQNVALELFERFVKLVRPAKTDKTSSK
jgi:hypothetical protein